MVTCLTETQSSDLKLAWIDPNRRKVTSSLTAPIYVTENPDGLQIVFVRHANKHSGRYLCVQTKSATEEKVGEILSRSQFTNQFNS